MSGGTLVGSVPVKVITYLAVAVCTSVILISYTISVSLGHVPAWLPMISDCAVQSPEVYLMRYGLILAAFLVAANALVVYAATKGSYRLAKPCMAAGLVGSFFLGLLVDVNEKENNVIHGTSAVIFFVCYEIYMVIISFNAELDPQVTSVSMNLKRVATVLAGIALVSLAAMSGNWSKHRLPIAICEWTAVLMIQVFNISFVQDLKGIRLDEVSTVSISRHTKLIDEVV